MKRKLIIHTRLILWYIYIYIYIYIYSLRSTNEFVVPNITRCYDKLCIGYKGPLLWNSLSIDKNH